MIAKLRRPSFTELVALTIICHNLVKGEIIKDSRLLCAEFTEKCDLIYDVVTQIMCASQGEGSISPSKKISQIRKLVSVTLGGSCKSVYDCDKIKFSKCSENNKCEWEAGFIAHDSLTCSLSQLSRSCTLDKNCSYVMHAKCRDNNKCVCRENNVTVNERCLPIVNGFCWKNETCATKNSICIDSTYQCNPGFKFSPQINECLQLCYYCYNS